MGRNDWEGLGAHFKSFDNELGGTSYITTGTLSVTDGEPNAATIGVLGQDDAETTFLLLPTTDHATLQLVLEALFSVGVQRTTLLELLPASPPVSLEDRMADLEQAVHGLMLEQILAAEPAPLSPSGDEGPRQRPAQVVRDDDPQSHKRTKALSHPVRVRILERLKQGPASPSELSGMLGTPLGATAYHVRTLRQLGLVELVREERRGGAIEHYYRATSQSMGVAASSTSLSARTTKATGRS